MPTMNITYSAGEGTRFAAAIGKMRGLVDENGVPRSATAGECKQFIIDTMRAIVFQQERNTAIQSIVEAPFDPS